MSICVCSTNLGQKVEPVLLAVLCVHLDLRLEVHLVRLELANLTKEGGGVRG